MKKRILFFAHTIDYAGTWRSHERIINSLDENLFEPYVFYWPKADNNRLNVMRNILPEENIVPYERSDEKTGPESGYRPLQTNFSELAKKYQFDIIHYGRSGYFEWPFNERLAPLQVETNIFGHRDNSDFLDKSITISNHVSGIRRGSDAVIYNPIPDAKFEGTSLREKLEIPEEAIVFGRIGRPANFTPIAIYAYAKLCQKYSNLYFIIIGPCEQIKQAVRANNIPNVILIEPTNNDKLIEQFHRSVDIFLHYRSDGETHGTGIAQAMMYGIPVVSHHSPVYNAQKETVATAGYVVSSAEEYFQSVEKLILNKELRNELSQKARKTALERYEQEKVVHKIQEKYLEWLNE